MVAGLKYWCEEIFFFYEFTWLTAIMWVRRKKCIVLKHAYYKNQACMSQATDSAMTTLVIVQPLFWLELENR
ncbi:unnamed protein product [Brassica oleracea]